MSKILRPIRVLAALFLLFGCVYSQNKFEGYSLAVEADLGGTCPIHYMPGTGNGNSIEVYLAGTNQRTPATKLTACDGSEVREGSKIFANGDGRWCFNGPEPFYDVKLRNGVTYLWYAMTKNTGFYNVKDFRPVSRGYGIERIESRPNFFGYNVEISDGLLQFDPKITFDDISKWATGSQSRPPLSDGALVYCKDCGKDNSGICVPGRAGTDGAFAKRINGRWWCD